MTDIEHHISLLETDLAQTVTEYGALKRQNDKLRLLMDSVILGAQSEFIDWAAMNRNSPDYVEGYKPDYPDWLIQAMEMRKEITKN